jgi:putative endonuclease
MVLGPIVGALSDDDTQGSKHELGRAGEQLAADYLEEQGLVVLTRNWRCPTGELDIVCTDGRTVVFCEVKTRSGVDYGAPLDAVNQHKVRRLRDLAKAWLHEQHLEGCPSRFDVLSVLWPPGNPPRIEHLAEAF